MKKAKLWAHATYEMVEHDDFSRRLNLPAYVRAENYDYIHQRCENFEAENARLKAEVERLKALTAEMDSTINVSQAACREYKAEVERLEEIVGSDAIDRKYGMCCDASDEVARLKAEVERLTKAGDAMIDEWWLQLSCPQRMKASWMQEQAIVEWNAAKEGKPRA